jgi:hypothetical protein
VITKNIYPFPKRSPECALGILTDVDILSHSVDVDYT